MENPRSTLKENAAYLKVRDHYVLPLWYVLYQRQIVNHLQLPLRASLTSIPTSINQ
jgi:hypothetical protein